MGEVATPEVLLVGCRKLTVAFPAMNKNMLNLLVERMVVNGFTNERAEDAINYVLDNFRYQVPNIADIITFDRRAKAYTYTEYCNMVANREADASDFVYREVAGRKKGVWIKITDL